MEWEPDYLFEGVFCVGAYPPADGETHVSIEAKIRSTSVSSLRQSYLGCREWNSVAAGSDSANCRGVRLAWGRRRERLRAIWHGDDEDDDDDQEQVG